MAKPKTPNEKSRQRRRDALTEPTKDEKRIAELVLLLQLAIERYKMLDAKLGEALQTISDLRLLTGRTRRTDERREAEAEKAADKPPGPPDPPAIPSRRVG